MTHPLFTKHEATLDKALAAIETRGYWSPFAEMPSPKVYGETANAEGEAAFKRHLNRQFRTGPAVDRRYRRQRAVSVRHRARHSLSEGRSRRAPRRFRRRAEKLARGRSQGVGRRESRNSVPPESREFRDRLQRDAYDRSGIHDVVSGRRSARAGPRSGSRRLRVGPAAPDSR